MFDWYQVGEMILKGLTGGTMGYLARRLFTGSQKDLEALQNKPPKEKDRDKEELLIYYVESLTERIGDVNELTVSESIIVIQSRAEVFVTYLHLKVQHLSSEGERPKDV